MMDMVRSLEGRSNRERRRLVWAALSEIAGLIPVAQSCRLLRVCNIVVDLGPQPRLLLSAHYDAYPGSPGANDNASGVAVLLEFCRLARNGAARVVFLDREEAWLRTPVVKLGLLGSLGYTWTADLRGIAAVYNLEFCGQGDFLAAWPIQDRQSEMPAWEAVERVAETLGIQHGWAHMPWPFLSSDHFPFRWRGIPNALTLSLLPSGQVPFLEKLVENLSILKLLTGRRPSLPEPLSRIHTPGDTSPKLSQESLDMMLTVLLHLSQEWTGPISQ